MWLYLQVPLADMRDFLPSTVPRLARPQWPNAQAPEFIRNFGGVRPRGKGGIGNWIGENDICGADNAIKFWRHPRLNLGINRSVSLQIQSRHLYADGQAVAKFDLIFRTLHRIPALGVSADEVCSALLALPAKVDLHDDSHNFMPLGSGKLRKRLAARYQISTARQSLREEALRCNGVRAGTPLIILQPYADELVRIPARARSILRDDYLGLYHWWHTGQFGEKIRVWAYTRGLSRDAADKGRVLRIYLDRLHAEHECLRCILGALSAGRLELEPGGERSQRLQLYLNESLSHISDYNHRAEKEFQTQEIGQLAYRAMYQASPGQQESLRLSIERSLQMLQAAQIRPQVYKKVEQHYRKCVFITGGNVTAGRSIMADMDSGDKYEIKGSIIGAAGPHAEGRVEASGASIVLGSQSTAQLAEELARLHSELLLVMDTDKADQYADIGKVATAQAAAKAGKLNEALAHLKKVGGWVVDVATKIGVTVAAAALKEAMGIK